MQDLATYKNNVFLGGKCWLAVDVHAGPILVGDHFDDALEVGGVGDLVLGLAEDDAK